MESVKFSNFVVKIYSLILFTENERCSNNDTGNVDKSQANSLFQMSGGAI